MNIERIKQLVRSTEPKTPEDVDAAKQRTRVLSVREGAAWSFMYGFGEVYVAPFALFLQAGNRAMAFLGTVPIILGALAQLLGVSLVDRMGRRLPLILLGVAAQAISYLLVFLFPLFFPAIGVPALLVIMTITLFLANLGTPAWASLMGEVVPDTERGRYFSRRSQIINFFIVVAMLGAGYTLSFFKVRGLIWTGFGVLFFVATCARFYCLWMLRQHYDPPPHEGPRDASFSFWNFVRRTPYSNFARFTFAVAVMNGATNIAGPFFNVYMLRDLQWSYVQFTANTVVFLCAQFFFVRWWGALCDRHGNRSVLVATSVLLPLLPLFWAFSSNFYFLMATQALSGCAWSGFNLAASNFIYDAVTPPKRTRAFSYYSVVNGFFSLVGGLLIGAWLADHVPATYQFGTVRVHFISTLPVVFIVSAVLRALAIAMLFPRFKEVRPAVPVSPVRILWWMTSGQPLFGQVGDFIQRFSAPRRARRAAAQPKGEA